MCVKKYERAIIGFNAFCGGIFKVAIWSPDYSLVNGPIFYDSQEVCILNPVCDNVVSNLYNLSAGCFSFWAIQAINSICLNGSYNWLYGYLTINNVLRKV
ncbi:hypothetical protein B0F88_10351 [Methylobacter tundripaludum]|uniref:Uncharacterized protein n=1 Tax=Methylobacter tundripaludum TaxID=173365 RepID=A0A2S6H556_9GAMM|nr:hypothetical protein B0F88_10351 [Methylobacter tundripaludum]